MFLKYLACFFISMLPIIELRGAMPTALEVFELNPVIALIVCTLGNMVPVPFIYFFARKVLEWGCDKKFIGKFFTFCLQKGEKGGEKLKKKAGKGGLFVALMLFVGIPLPGTGAWTGTLAASFINMGFKETTISVVLGVLMAGVIVGLFFAGVFDGIEFLRNAVAI